MERRIMRVAVPNATVDNTYEAFPAGDYEGTIEGASIRDPNQDGSWVLAKLSLTSVTPREGTADPGRSAFSGDITIANTDKSGKFADVRELTEINGKTPFAVKRGVGLLAGLATAVGAGERDNSHTSVDLKATVDALVDGAFNGQRIAFRVSHYNDRDQIEVIGPTS
jgi:hypothetical protein